MFNGFILFDIRSKEQQRTGESENIVKQNIYKIIVEVTFVLCHRLTIFRFQTTHIVCGCFNLIAS